MRKKNSPKKNVPDSAGNRRRGCLLPVRWRKSAKSGTFEYRSGTLCVVSVDEIAFTHVISDTFTETIGFFELGETDQSATAFAAQAGNRVGEVLGAHWTQLAPFWQEWFANWPALWPQLRAMWPGLTEDARQEFRKLVRPALDFYKQASAPAHPPSPPQSPHHSPAGDFAQRYSEDMAARRVVEGQMEFLQAQRENR